MATSTPTSTESSVPVGWTNYTADNFEIALPDSWVVAKVDFQFPQLTLSVEDRQQLKDLSDAIKFHATDTDTNATVSGGGYLDANIYVSCKLAVQSFDDDFAQYKSENEFITKVVSYEHFVMNGQDAVRMELAGYIPIGNEQDEQRIPVEYRIICTDHKGSRYDIRLTCFPTDMPGYSTMFDTAANTFHFTE